MFFLPFFQPYFFLFLVYINTNNSCTITRILSKYYILNHIKEDGKFIYIAQLPNSYKYNILRHGGTLYAMWLYEHFYHDKNIKQKRLSATKYLIDNYVVKIDPDMYCVVSKPTDGETEEFIAKSGGTGISLISLSSYYNSGIFNNKIIEGLGNFLIFLQENSGNFITCYEMKSGKKTIVTLVFIILEKLVWDYCIYTKTILRKNGWCPQKKHLFILHN